MRTAIVTGAGGNLGQAVCRKFLEAGYQVAGSFTGPEKIEDPSVAGITERMVTNLENEENAGEFVATIIKKFQTIGVAVLTVGGYASGDIGDTSLSDIDKQIKTNFHTAYNVARPVFIQMKKQGYGRIFLIGSRPGEHLQNSNGMIAYGLAKSLVFGLASILNEEAKGTNVVTGVIVPSIIDTPQNRRAMPNADPKNWVSPEAIADIIYFYCSAEGSLIREPVIRVFGNS